MKKNFKETSILQEYSDVMMTINNLIEGQNIRQFSNESWTASVSAIYLKSKQLENSLKFEKQISSLRMWKNT